MFVYGSLIDSLKELTKELKSVHMRDFLYFNSIH